MISVSRVKGAEWASLIMVRPKVLEYSFLPVLSMTMAPMPGERFSVMSFWKEASRWAVMLGGW